MRGNLLIDDRVEMSESVKKMTLEELEEKLYNLRIQEEKRLAIEPKQMNQ